MESVEYLYIVVAGCQNFVEGDNRVVDVENIEFDEKLDTRVTAKTNAGAVKALIGLGGSPEAAAKSVTEAQRVLGAAAKIEDLTRLALRYLSQNR